MIMVWITHALFASTFTITKIALEYVSPFMLISIRLLLGGGVLLGWYWQKYGLPRYNYELLIHGINLSLFLGYFPFACEFWAMQFVSSSKGCLLYNLAPFVTALLSFFILKERLLTKQWIGLIIGFLGFIPILLTQSPAEEVWGLSWISAPELALIGAVITSSYAWILVQRAQQVDGYSAYFLNGIGMLGGGLIALIHTLLLEGVSGIHYPIMHEGWQASVSPTIVFLGSTILLTSISTTCFILYSVLLNRYSATFMSFSAFTTPLFAALYGYVFLGEVLGWSFGITMAIVFVGLYLYCTNEQQKENLIYS